VIYIFRPRYSEGAEDLAYALSEAGIKARYVRNAERLQQRLTAQDRVVCWGTELPFRVEVPVLNAGPVRSKFADAVNLKAAEVPTIEVSRTRPVVVPATRGELILSADGIARPSADGDCDLTFNEQAARHTLAELQRWLALPLPPTAEWLPRSNSHVGGNDLLSPPAHPDFWVKKEDIRGEFRIHSFLGKSIRAGRKVQQQRETPAHPWIRSLDAGWILRYEGFSSPKPARDLAAKAVEALGLQFGAVDLAVLGDGRTIVLEVNRAPGIEGGTIEAYVGAVRRWMEE
jgi:hypothetical protein